MKQQLLAVNSLGCSLVSIAHMLNKHKVAHTICHCPYNLNVCSHNWGYTIQKNVCSALKNTLWVQTISTAVVTSERLSQDQNQKKSYFFLANRCGFQRYFLLCFLDWSLLFFFVWFPQIPSIHLPLHSHRFPHICKFMQMEMLANTMLKFMRRIISIDNTKWKSQRL